MIRISQATRSDNKLKAFSEVEWKFANAEHYDSNSGLDYNQKDAIFKAVDEENIVGSIKCSHEAGVLYINYLIVSHDKKGQGIGKALMQKAESFGKKMGAHKVHLSTGLGWEAEKFYQKLGFLQVAILPNHHFHKDFIVYEKLL